jgi:uncharacterized protein (DUF1501 family)
MANLITRRSFIGRSTFAAVMSSFATVPLFVQRALAEGNIGLNGKKVLFIFLRGANDGLNAVVPIQDSAYATARPTIGITKDPDPTKLYDAVTGKADVVAAGYPYGIRLGNGFAALHPALYNLSSVYNDGNLALIHRVAYRGQSRSHFDSQNYWENGVPNNNSLREGIFYRTMHEAINASPAVAQRALTAVSVQSTMPLMIRGKIPMTNLSSVGRYNLLGVYSTDRAKHTNAIAAASQTLHPDKDNRDLIYGLGVQFKETLNKFQDQVFLSNNYFDPANPTAPLFPANDNFYSSLKTATQILAQTDAVVAGTQLDGFDTHTGQGSATGAQANLLKRVGWGIYAVQQYFKTYGKGGPMAVNADSQTSWNDVIVVTLSEFGRTSDENASLGTDHAEASVMFVAGGGITPGVYGCDTNIHPVTHQPNWVPGNALANGSMYGASGRYLKRLVDFRSVLGEIIRKHLGATDGQLARIIPGYASEATEHLRSGLASPTAPLIGEVGLLPGV